MNPGQKICHAWGPRVGERWELRVPRLIKNEPISVRLNRQFQCSLSYKPALRQDIDRQELEVKYKSFLKAFGMDEDEDKERRNVFDKVGLFSDNVFGCSEKRCSKTCFLRVEVLTTFTVSQIYSARSWSSPGTWSFELKLFYETWDSILLEKSRASLSLKWLQAKWSYCGVLYTSLF